MANVRLIARIKVPQPDGTSKFTRVMVDTHTRTGKLKPIVEEPTSVTLNGKKVMVTVSRYYLRFTEGGKRIDQPVGEVFATAYDYLKEKHEDRFLAKQGIDRPAPVSVDNRINISEAVAAWRKKITADEEYSRSTVRTYTNAANLFVQFCAVIRVFFLDAIQREHMEKFGQWIRENSITRAGGNWQGNVHSKLQNIRVFFNANGRDVPWPQKDWPIVPKTKPQAFTIQEISKLMGAADADEKDLLTFFLHTGFRVQEVANALYKWIDWENESINPEEYGAFRIKNRLPREGGISISPELRQRMKARQARYKAADGALIFPMANGRPMWNTTALEILRGIADKAGMPEAFPADQRQGCHKLRKTFATLLKTRAGVDSVDIQSMLGHASLKTTERYLATTVTNPKQMQKGFSLVGK